MKSYVRLKVADEICKGRRGGHDDGGKKDLQSGSLEERESGISALSRSLKDQFKDKYIRTLREERQ